MNKIIIIDGGAGRVIASISSLEKYVNDHPKDKITIIIRGWDSLLWGNKVLQDITFSSETKGLFENYYKQADIVITPEPYRNPNYYNQKISLSEAFNIELNSENKIKVSELFLTKSEILNSQNIIKDVKRHQGKEKTIVIQPFGSSAKIEDGIIIDESNRSFSKEMYLLMVSDLSKKYNIILFGDNKFQLPEDIYSYKVNADLRTNMSIVYSADYFIGCDSVGQHIARSFNKKGTIIFGSTFPVNVSYPDWFRIVDKYKDKKKYSPIRISEFECSIANRYNDNVMDYSLREIENICSLIDEDLKCVCITCNLKCEKC